jgi:hypothetical protein
MLRSEAGRTGRPPHRRQIMLRRNHLIVTAALVAVCAVPGTAAAQQDLRMPDTRDAAAASAADGYQDLRSPDAKDAARQAGTAPDSAAYVLDRNYGSPDAVDAARDLPPLQIPTPVVEVKGAPSGGFDWGDAGIGAAGMLALFSIAAGSILLLTGRKRRDGLRVAH